MSINYKAYIRELAPIAQWDPSEEGLNPRVEMNPTKINHLTKRFILQEMGGLELERELGMTAYEIAKHHPTGNNMLLLTGMVDPSEYVRVIRDGKNANQLFNPVVDDAEEYLKTLRECSTMLTAQLARPSAVELGGLGTLELPNEGPLTAINALLRDSKLPDLEDVFKELSEFDGKMEAKDAERKKAMQKLQEEIDENERLRTELTKVMTTASFGAGDFTEEATLGIPEGKVVMRKASEVFPGVKLKTDFEIPTWEWEHEHPDVPSVDEHYIFRPQHLQRTLYALVTNQRQYIQGHTGSGKTTLIEQIAAHLNWPFIRINFDSEITRMDLIGRDTLVTDGEGNVTSQFEDGMLPRAMSGPYLCCFDEIDFCRPDVAYVMQSALEGNGLRITEDGDRMVRPHPMFRMFATGNTVGQGDEHGMYQGARPQSIAFLDRFTIWDRIEYLTDKERQSLVERHYPMLSKEDKKAILQYVTEHLEAFTTGKVIQPISPRGMLAVCKATIALGSVRTALEMSVLDRANTEDRATLKGLVDRVTR